MRPQLLISTAVTSTSVSVVGRQFDLRHIIDMLVIIGTLVWRVSHWIDFWRVFDMLVFRFLAFLFCVMSICCHIHNFWHYFCSFFSISLFCPPDVSFEKWSVLSRTIFMSLEFWTERKTTGMSIRLWEGSPLVNLCIMRRGSDLPLIKSQIRMISNLLGAVSEKLDIVCCGGVGVDVLKTLDKMPTTKVGLQCPFSIYGLQVEKLLEKPSYSVMGQIDLLGFALLKSLLSRIVDCLDFKCMRTTQSLRKVSQDFVLKRILTQIRFSLNFAIRLSKDSFWMSTNST